MLSCEEVTRLLSDSMDRRLPLRQQVAVRMHLFMCKLCSRYRRQLLFLREAMRRYAEDLEQGKLVPPVSLSEEARERMKSTLRAGSES
jgi:predicted anti-sigma-YlaC factor YlaD